MQIIVSCEKSHTSVQLKLPLKSAKKTIRLKAINYLVGYYNVSEELRNNQVDYYANNDYVNFVIPDGYYNFEDLTKIITEIYDNKVKFSVKPYNGIMHYTMAENSVLRLNEKLSQMLGFAKNTNLTVNGEQPVKPIDLLPFHSIRIHCNQIDAQKSLINSGPTTIMETIVIPNLSIGHMYCKDFLDRHAYRLPDQEIHRLEFSITSDTNVPLVNRYPVNLSFVVNYI